MAIPRGFTDTQRRSSAPGALKAQTKPRQTAAHTREGQSPLGRSSGPSWRAHRPTRPGDPAPVLPQEDRGAFRHEHEPWPPWPPRRMAVTRGERSSARRNVPRRRFSCVSLCVASVRTAANGTCNRSWALSVRIICHSLCRPVAALPLQDAQVSACKYLYLLHLLQVPRPKLSNMRLQWSPPSPCHTCHLLKTVTLTFLISGHLAPDSTA